MLCGEFPFQEATLNCDVFVEHVRGEMKTREWFSHELQELFDGVLLSSVPKCMIIEVKTVEVQLMYSQAVPGRFAQS